MNRYKQSFNRYLDSYNMEDVLSKIDISRIKEDQKFILLASPCRSGSSVLLLLFSQLGRAYYQPLKTIFRHADATISFPESSQPFLVKETFGFSRDIDCSFNPLEIFLSLGIKKENIQLILLLRNPVDTYVSWLNVFDNFTLDSFVKSYLNVFSIAEFAEDHQVKMLKICYEDISKNFVASLFRACDLDFDPKDLQVKWGKETVYENKNIVMPKEAEDPLWSKLFIGSVMKKGGLHLNKRQPDHLDKEQMAAINELLMPRYHAFRNVSFGHHTSE